MSYAFLRKKRRRPADLLRVGKKAKEERGYPFLSVCKSLCDPIILGSLEVFKISDGEFCIFLWWWWISGGWSEDGISGRGAEIPCISTRGIYKLRPLLYPRGLSCLSHPVLTTTFTISEQKTSYPDGGNPSLDFLGISGEFLGENLNFRRMSIIRIQCFMLSPNPKPSRLSHPPSLSSIYRVSQKRRPFPKILKVDISHYFTFSIITEQIRNNFDF